MKSVQAAKGRDDFQYRDAARDERCSPGRSARRAISTSSGDTDFTAPAVPTGMKAGVSTDAVG
jgi:hypothetical protein